MKDTSSYVLFLQYNFVLSLGERPDFILPDRKKYVSMDKQYLKSYMDLVIKVRCVTLLQFCSITIQNIYSR